MLVVAGESGLVPAEHRGDVFPASPFGGCFEGDAGAEPAGGGEVAEGVAADGVESVGLWEGEFAGLLPGAFLEV